MVRGPLPSGRAPAHLSVLPGGAGAGGLDDLEDDRTTIEPAPTADEAPTPIAAASSLEEQWEDGTTVAEQSSTTNASSKRNAVVEESTIEDQAKPLPPLHLVPPPQAPDPASAAKLVVVGGPDQGRVFDLRSGSEVRIGRAVDNDVVLTDIAVSRKHLVLSWDGAAWVVHDNGSGNGTLINDRLEDGRCQLHHADRVEIGNTVLRFDHLPSAHQPSIAGWGQRDEEAATVAGKAPVRASQVAAAATVEPPRHRPASVTAPVRDRPSPPRKKPGATEPPPPPSSRPRAGTTPPPPPRATASAAVVPPPSMSSGAPPPRVLTAPPSAPIPATLTGAPSAPVPMPMSGPYTAPMAGPPMAAMTGPQFAPFGGGVRPMTTTAQVDPRPYGMAAPSAYAMTAAPRRRQRLWLGIGAVSLVAIVATGAVLGGGDTKPTTATTAGSGSAVAPAPTPDQPGVLAATVEPTPSAGTGSGSGSAAAVVAPAPEVVPAPTPPAPEVAPPSPEVAVVPAPTPTPEVAPTPPAPEVDRTTDRPVDRTTDRTPPRPVDRTPPRTVVRTTSPGRSLDIDTPTATNKPAAGSKALAAATKKADGQYRSKDWKGAAATLREAIGGSTEPEVKTMKARAADYEAIGNNLTAALAMSSARSTEALSAYKKAMAADRRAGGAHQQFLRDKIGDVAPNAAASYMVKQNYELAKSAADDAVNVGAGGNARIEGVRTSLERRAGEFYATAVKLQKSKPEDAKGLARRITKMVPASSPWYAKAIKLLNASSGSRSDDDE